ncbi:MAG: sugar ABC transporter permease [Microbacterium sp. 69-10]|uniref:carbohydrate ABC transporter permease n=1 Tax=Microbacterium sp. 69-10 TaxID=1895783 RepID=UPI000962527D|nr:sugar ABC transporter permease [Microbacterium sp. 69-10]OJU40270.1 MAG: sugar ABC transporter permease [Microbacterium sp. 69-10]
MSALATRPARSAGASLAGPRHVPYLYLLPGLLLVGAFVLYPLGRTLQVSFTDWNGVTPPNFIGVENYIEILTDPVLRSLFLHAAVLIFFYALLPIALGLLITSVLARWSVRGMTVYRAVLFVPQAISMVVVAIAWQWVFASTGILNQLLSLFGNDVTTAWLGSFEWALPAVGLTGTWRQIGLCMVLFLAGVQKIDPALYEAAQLDGASAWHEFRYVTLPGLRAEVAVALTLTVTAALKSFDLVYLMTKGGPGTSTSVPGYEIFARAFNRGEIGSAASLGVTLTLVIVLVAFAIERFRREP